MVRVPNLPIHRHTVVDGVRLLARVNIWLTGKLLLDCEGALYEVEDHEVSAGMVELIPTKRESGSCTLAHSSTPEK